LSDDLVDQLTVGAHWLNIRHSDRTAGVPLPPDRMGSANAVTRCKHVPFWVPDLQYQGTLHPVGKQAWARLCSYSIPAVGSA
jgi:hypothetical protein